MIRVLGVIREPLNSNLTGKFIKNTLKIYHANESILQFFIESPVGITPVYVSASTKDVPYEYVQGFISKRNIFEGQIILTGSYEGAAYIGYVLGTEATNTKIKWRKVLTEVI